METRIRVREMRNEDLPRAVEVLARAFSTNPNALAAMGGKAPPARKLEIAFAGRFKYLPGSAFVADLDGQIVGAMRIVEWPGCQASMLQSLKMMPSMLRAVGGPRQIIRGMRLLNTWKRHDPRKPHWHLDPLGVAPEQQGKGIGSRMMEHYCRIVDAKGTEAYHETDKPENVPFYGRFGFKVAGQQTINGVTNWFLLRPAKKETLDSRD